ncbi:MAG: hypothetical protein WCX97_01590 [Candidatus Magasanikbacteria bacterium]|jgi:hypothetical protein
MTNNLAGLSRAEKIILVMYKMSEGTKKNLKYEDIVVGAFKMFAENFHLRGYSEYPDSGDLVHKPLYDFRKKGLIEANNKVFSLTDRGISFAEQVEIQASGKQVGYSGRLSRFTEKEVARIETTEGFQLFVDGKTDKITDTDFFNYIGVTPRTSKNDFLGRFDTVCSAVEELNNQKNLPFIREKIDPYHKFMLEKFQSIISHYQTK